MIARALGVLLASFGVASGQSVGAGMKAGVPVTDNFDTGSSGYIKSYFESSSKTKRYTLGLTVTLYLLHRLGMEIDGLYRRLNYDWYNVTYESATDGGVVYDRANTTGNRIDIPLLLRWSPLRRLYAVGGPAFGIHYGFDERLHHTQDLILAGYADTTAASSRPFAHRVSTGMAAGIGFDIPAKRLHIKPEVRWTHWLRPAFNPYLYLAPVTDEVELLFGLEFRRPATQSLNRTKRQ